MTRINIFCIKTVHTETPYQMEFDPSEYYTDEHVYQLQAQIDANFSEPYNFNLLTNQTTIAVPGINIIDVNEIDFETKVLEESLNKLIVVDFWAPWCGPCKQLTPILEKVILSSPDKIVLAKINIDENQQIATQLRIQSIPTV